MQLSGGVNRLHHWYCNREAWKRHVREELVPPAIEGLDLGEDVLEVGPGFGPATEVLAGRTPMLTALEIEPRLARSLRERLGAQAEIVEGEAILMVSTSPMRPPARAMAPETRSREPER